MSCLVASWGAEAQPILLEPNVIAVNGIARPRGATGFEVINGQIRYVFSNSGQTPSSLYPGSNQASGFAGNFSSPFGGSQPSSASFVPLSPNVIAINGQPVRPGAAGFNINGGNVEWVDASGRPLQGQFSSGTAGSSQNAQPAAMDSEAGNATFHGAPAADQMTSLPSRPVDEMSPTLGGQLNPKFIPKKEFQKPDPDRKKGQEDENHFAESKASGFAVKLVAAEKVSSGASPSTDVYQEVVAGQNAKGVILKTNLCGLTLTEHWKDSSGTPFCAFLGSAHCAPRGFNPERPIAIVESKTTGVTAMAIARHPRYQNGGPNDMAVFFQSGQACQETRKNAGEAIPVCSPMPGGEGEENDLRIASANQRKDLKLGQVFVHGNSLYGEDGMVTVTQEEGDQASPSVKPIDVGDSGGAAFVFKDGKKCLFGTVAEVSGRLSPQRVYIQSGEPLQWAVSEIERIKRSTQGAPREQDLAATR